MFLGTLLAHQRAGIDFMVHRERSCQPAGGLLADEPGLGKTIMTIGLVLEHQVGATLIVCPKAVEAQWAAELGRFAGINAQLLRRGRAKGSPSAGAPTWQVGILSYTQLARSQRNPLVRELLESRFGRVVFDEGHMLRNPLGRTHQAAVALVRRARHVWLLSGTPLVNGPRDVWAMLRVLGCAGPERTCHDHALIRRALRPVMLRRTMQDISGSLPELKASLERTSFESEEEAELYAIVEAHCKHKAWLGMRSGNDALVMEALTRCRQMVIHPELVIRGLARKQFPDSLTPELPTTWPFMSTKLRAVTQLVAKHQASEKVLVLCSFLEEMELIAMVLKRMHGIEVLSYCGKLGAAEREAVVAAFTKAGGEWRVLLVQVQAGGTGLNLQAASRVIISSMPWTPSLESQGIHRAYRLGQTRPVHVHKVVVAGTIDERMLSTQARKDGAAYDLLAPVSSPQSHSTRHRRRPPPPMTASSPSPRGRSGRQCPQPA